VNGKHGDQLRPGKGNQDFRIERPAPQRVRQKDNGCPKWNKANEKANRKVVPESVVELALQSQYLFQFRVGSCAVGEMLRLWTFDKRRPMM
jgi:hypothetical protein